MPAIDKITFTRTDWVVDRLARGLIRGLMSLPYERRVALTGTLMRRAIGPLMGHRGRVRANLAHVWPDLPEARIREITDGCLDNMGRVVIENYSTAEQLDRARAWEPQGPGYAAAQAARDAGTPIIFISGHFGNYQAARAAMNVRGFEMGAIYRTMNNGYFNEHYVRTIEEVGGPVFPRGRRGTAGFVRHVQAGGQGSLLIDVFFSDGVAMDFLGKPAPTPVSAAEIALKHGALLIPTFGIRRANGFDFDIVLEDPVPHTKAAEMIQSVTDSLAAHVTRLPEQWFWVHRRWKPERQARLARYRAEQEAEAESRP